MKLTDKQTEAILWAMFGIESEIEHLKYLLIGLDREQNETFLRNQLKTRQEHFLALKELFEGSKAKDDEE